MLWAGIPQEHLRKNLSLPVLLPVMKKRSPPTKKPPHSQGGFSFQTQPATTYLVTLNVAVLLVVPVAAVMTLVLVAV